MSSKNILELKNISKSYGENKVLEDISIKANRGEIIALIGLSGSGKTTTLNIMSNIIKPDTGEMLVDGAPSTNIYNRKEFAKKIGVIRQQFDLVNQLPVVHNTLAGRFNDWGVLKSIISLIKPQDLPLAKGALSRVGMLEKIYEKTGNLSGGEQQRVALARLLLQKPEIILADEPVSSLDPARAENILSLMVDLVKEGHQTLIASLHSVEYVKKYFTRVIAIKDGKIYFDLPIKKIKDKDLVEVYHLKELS